MVISAQVMQQTGTSNALKKTPATIQFTFNSSAYNSTVRHIPKYYICLKQNKPAYTDGKVQLCVLAV